MKRRSATPRWVALAVGPLCTLALAVPAAASATTAGQRPTVPAARQQGPPAAHHGRPPSALAGYFNSGSPSSSQTYNSTGGPVSIASLGPGQYQVTFGQLGGIFAHGGGNVEVTHLTLSTTCSVVSWAGTGPDLDVFVDCFSFSGAPASALFAVLVTRPTSAPRGVLDFDWVQHPARSYVLTGKFQYNSSHRRNAVRHLGTGRYIVAMQGPKPSGTGTVKISPYGAAGGDCNLAKWIGTSAGEAVYVDCYSATGQRQDRQFGIVYARTNNLMGQNGKTDANGFAHRSAGVYQPHPQFDSHRGGAVTVVRLTSTLYQVFFGGAQGSSGDANGGGGDVQVTPVGSSDKHCAVEWQQELTPYSFVVCQNNSGVHVSSKFIVQWVVA